MFIQVQGTRRYFFLFLFSSFFFLFFYDGISLDRGSNISSDGPRVRSSRRSRDSVSGVRRSRLAAHCLSVRRCHFCPLSLAPYPPGALSGAVISSSTTEQRRLAWNKVGAGTLVRGKLRYITMFCGQIRFSAV